MKTQVGAAKDRVIEILRDSLAEKLERNPRYSSRAFARDIGVSPAFVSMVLKGKKKISLDRARQISVALDMPERKRVHFLRMVALATLPTTRSTAEELEDLILVRSSRKDIFPIEVDQFKFFSSWYHVAILDLTLCDDFNPDPVWIAKRLQIPEVAAHDSVQRLIRLGLLERKKGQLKKTNHHISVPTQGAQVSIRNFHQQMIDKAKETLQDSSEQAFERRSISGITMAIDPSKMDEAKRRIEEFKNQMADLLTEGKCTEVYQLNLQFFPLTKSAKGDES